MKYIAILITVYNRKETTLRCLRDLKRQEMPDEYTIEVYMTNDGCTDGTREAVAEQFPEVNIIDGDGNLYWNKGMIAAWEEAIRHRDYDFYLWLNDDTILLEGAIARLLKCSESLDDKALLVGTTTDESDESIITYGGRNNHRKILQPYEDSPRPCRLINGNVVLVPKYVYEIIGMNDSFYSHSRGDFDYSMRATESGVKVYIAPRIFGRCNRHDYSTLWFAPQTPLKQRWKLYQSRTGFNCTEEFYFRKKHYGILYAIVHRIINDVHVLIPQLWEKL